METTRIDVPTELLRVANPGAIDLSTEAVRLLALELFREEKISLGRAAELCHTPLATFMDFVPLIMSPRFATDWANWKRTASPDRIHLKKLNRREAATNLEDDQHNRAD